MSRSKNLNEARRWLTTAEEDLVAAEVLSKAGSFSQACFLSQQSAEKAVQAMWYLIGADPWGHSVQRLLVEFPQKDRLGDMPRLIEQAGLLDKFYIPTRYPNGLPDLTPGQVYGRADSERGLQAAKLFIDICRELIKQAD